MIGAGSGMHAALRTLCLALVASSVLAGCASAPQTGDATLYAQLGGESGIESIVTSMLRRIAEDERVAAIFGAANLVRLHDLLEEQFCEITDGPCVYSGFSMAESHRGMRVTEAEFNAVVEALILAMEDLDLDVPVQNQLLARLAPLRGEIVDL